MPQCRFRQRRQPPLVAAAAAGGDVDASTAAAWLGLSVLLPTIAVPLIKAYLRPRKCATCLGSTTVTCDQCKGRGRLGFALPGVAEAAAAAGTTAAPSSRCKTCDGRGRVACERCGRTGLANAWLWKPTDDPDAWGARGE